MTHGQSKPVGVVQLDGTVRKVGTERIGVMTLNMAHGRADGRNQIFQSKSSIERNILSVGELIASENPQIVALQEADAPSWWSGSFSHVEAVGNIGGMSSAVQGLNVDGLGLHYGVAVVTQLDITLARQVTFRKNPPSFSKGFVVVTCHWPGDPGFAFDVVSLHLDFASHKVRSQQLALLTELVNTSTRPIILMGDFNTDMSSDLLPNFLNDTGLTAWRVDDQSIITFPILKSRIDWILVSPEFLITDHKVIDTGLSDHRFVSAMLERAN